MADSPSDGYLRGDGAAARYLGYKDKQGRMFRRWAKRNKIPCDASSGQRTYKKSDIDAAWSKNARAAR